MQPLDKPRPFAIIDTLIVKLYSNMSSAEEFLGNHEGDGGSVENLSPEELEARQKKMATLQEEVNHMGENADDDVPDDHLEAPKRVA